MPVEKYMPIEGVDLEIMPEVALRGKDRWEMQLYAQENGLQMLSLLEIYKVAQAVKPENPTEKFLKYAVEHSKYNEKTITELYSQLHEQLWSKDYDLIAGEFLVWARLEEPAIYNPRIKIELRIPKLQAYLITDSKVVEKAL